MSLILTRKAGDAIRVGTHYVRVERVTRANTNLLVCDPRRMHNCAPLDMVILEPGVTITIVAISRSTVRMAIDAPPHIKVMRSEIDDHDDNS